MSQLERGQDNLLLVYDANVKRTFKVPKTFRLYRNALPRLGAAHQNIFVSCPASQLEKVAKVVSAANKRHRLRVLLVQSDVDASWLPQMLDRAELRSVQNMLVHSEEDLPARVMRAWELGAQAHLIAKATVLGSRLFVVSCDAVQHEIAFDAMPALRRIPARSREQFQLADDGSYLYWPDADVHLDLDAIRSVLDPEWNQKALSRRLSHDAEMGAAIKSLRKEAGLKQGDIKGLSERQVRRIENGESASLASLTRLATAHGLAVERYLDKVAERRGTL
jgi:hypothetical protein